MLIKIFFYKFIQNAIMKYNIFKTTNLAIPLSVLQTLFLSKL